MKTNLLLVIVIGILNLPAFGKSSKIEKNVNDTLIIRGISKELYICTCKPDVSNPSGRGELYFQGFYNKENYSACDERFLIQWNLSELPAGVKIVEAKMELYCRDYVGDKQGELIYEYINEPWTEDIGYGKKPNTSGIDKISTNLPTAGQYHSVDVTNFVKKWHNKVIPNYGLMGYGANMKTTNSAVFCSSKYFGENFRPKLIVIYQKIKP